MKAIRIHEPGGFEVIRYEDVPEPEIAPHQVLVKVEAIGVNYADTFDAPNAAAYNGPFIMGGEAAGTVVKAGTNVTQYRVGDRLAWSRTWESYAEYVAVNEDALVFPLPDRVSMTDAAAILVQGMTAHYLATDVYALKPGDSCLVHAAAGGVGHLLTQVAKMKGATVIGTVSTPDKARVARECGADHVVIYSDVDFEDEVKRLTDGEGVNVVYDAVGQTTFTKGFSCLKPRGLMVSYGRSSGAIEPFDSTLLRGSLYLTRTSLAAYTTTKAEAEGRVRDLFEWFAEGRLKPRIHKEYPLSQAAQALTDIKKKKTAAL